MKINDVENLLGITKANIRFYEKEGLLAPARRENGYRDYSVEDISRLKEIVILRKLGIPVQQVADILDGVLPLQDALDGNIAALQQEIEKLNGSLALCKQLKQEDARTLDTERYWEIIQEKEQQGFKFQDFVYDYLEFMRPVLEMVFWYVPDRNDGLKKAVKYISLIAAASAALDTITGDNFIFSFFERIFQLVCCFLFWFIVLLIPYIISKKDPQKGENLRFWVHLLTYLIVIILVIAALTFQIASLA